MTRADASEAAAVLRRLLTSLGAVGSASGATGAALRQKIGALSASAEAKVRAWGFGSDLAAAFRSATTAGATYSGMGRVVSAAMIERPSGLAGKAISTGFVRFGLIEQGAILSRTTFASRDEVDAALAVANAGFEAAEEYAADAGEDGVYRSLVSLHAAIVRDLGQRGRPLPRMVSYTFPRPLPVLTLANRLYGGADRAEEIRRENAIVHPLFPASTVRALSA